MNKRILVVYKSVTGFTEQYAKWIGEELDCPVMNFSIITAEKMSEFNTIIFGGRFHAGLVDGLKKVKGIFGQSTAKRLIVFATGAMPSTAEEMIEGAWKNNFTAEELERIPHFYLQGGLRYEKMPLGDKLMMKVFAAMVKGKKDKSGEEKAMEKAIRSSYDLSSKEYIRPLTSYVTKGEQEE